MTASADRAHPLIGHRGPSCRSRRGVHRWADDQVDTEFAAIIKRHHEVQIDASTVPSAERDDGRAAGPTAELRERVGRIASALFCTSGLDPQVLAFAIQRLAEHCALDEGQVSDRIADDVLRIAVSLAPGR